MCLSVSQNDWEKANELCIFFLWHQVLTKATFEEALPCTSASFEQDVEAIIQVYYRLGPICVVFVMSFYDDNTVLANITKN